ncbi:hypothetical protein GCM10022219_10340 [Microbacterium oryzae]|nr:M23 family metallopeptidase [Microbacterium oryzae]
MAENPVSAGAPDTVETSQTNAPANGPVVMSRSDVRRMERAALRAAAPKVKPVRTVGTLAAVLALIAGVAVPAYAATQPSAETVSLQDAAESEAQSIAVDAAVKAEPLGGAAYSATTPEEIEQAKAEAAAAAAAERAREQAEKAAAEQKQQAEAQQRQQQAQVQPAQPQAPQAPQAPQPQTYEAPAQNAGGICPLPAGSYYVSRSVSSGHEGADMVAPAMTPIYAVKSGQVITSQEALGGWGVVVAIDHGDGTTSLYGHMTYGTRQVQVGDTVSAGQIIGYVGSTGHSTANHLHIEYRINGAIVDPLNYLPI